MHQPKRQKGAALVQAPFCSATGRKIRTCKLGLQAWFMASAFVRGRLLHPRSPQYVLARVGQSGNLLLKLVAKDRLIAIVGERGKLKKSLKE